MKTVRRQLDPGSSRNAQRGLDLFRDPRNRAESEYQTKQSRSVAKRQFKMAFVFFKDTKTRNKGYNYSGEGEKRLTSELRRALNAQRRRKAAL